MAITSLTLKRRSRKIYSHKKKKKKKQRKRYIEKRKNRQIQLLILVFSWEPVMIWNIIACRCIGILIVNPILWFKLVQIVFSLQWNWRVSNYINKIKLVTLHIYISNVTYFIYIMYMHMLHIYIMFNRSKLHMSVTTFL